MKFTLLIFALIGFAFGAPLHAQLELDRPENHGGFNSFAFSPDGKSIAGGTGVVTFRVDGVESKRGGDVVLWDAASGKIREILGSHEGSAPDWVAYDEGGTTIASASTENGLLKFWTANGKPLAKPIETGGKIADGPNGYGVLVRLSPDGTAAFSVLANERTFGKITVKDGGELACWDTKTGKKKWSIEDSALNLIALSSDGGLIAGFENRVGKYVQDGDSVRHEEVTRALVFRSTGDGKEVKRIDMTKSRVRPRAMMFDPASSDLFGVTSSGIHRIRFDSGETEELFKWDKANRGANSVAISADGKKIARCGTKFIEVADFASGKPIVILEAKFLFNLNFSSDLSRAAGSSQGPKVYDLKP
ncbi:MAG: WD40 repeat protein [Verrucomicrobiales bacterium]|jgi:WD40 repeat protein